jgi:hypothetical protein
VDEHLDHLISRSAPPVGARTDALQRDLYALVAETEAVVSSRPRRGRRRVASVALGASAVLALGAAASATGVLPRTWFNDESASHSTVMLSSGTKCDVTYAARPVKDPAQPVGQNERSKAVAYANRFLRDLDPSSISTEDAVRRLNAMSFTRAPDDAPMPQGVALTGSPVDRELDAVRVEIEHRLQSGLSERGLPARAISVAAMTNCDGSTR